MRTLRISQRQLDALPEYSMSLPSGRYLGKLWKARYRNGWIIYGYTVSHFNPGDMVAIRDWLPEIMPTDSAFVEALGVSYREEVKASFKEF